jgi:hypothetical protein
VIHGPFEPAFRLLGHHGRDVVVDLGQYALLAEAAR